MRKIKLILGASILLLVSVQAGAGIISGASPMEGAELWIYSVEGSANYNDGSSMHISGSMLIDTTVREWSSPYAPRTEVCTCPNFFQILGFDLRIGDLSFFGGGPLSNSGNSNHLFFDTFENTP